ncbi:MAG: hypothetical protein KAS32_24200 [Candidatus Peribacteraceae bacterium]|nr:hypothetical protein [Candidatus Peribacteraceae bacterium]
MSIDDLLNKSLGISDELAGYVDDPDQGGDKDIVPAVMDIATVESDIPEYAESDLAKDYKHARNILYTLLTKTNNALEGALGVAIQSEHPRAYSVANELIRSARELTADLMALQNTYTRVQKETTKKVTDFVEGESKDGVTVNGDAIVFSGSTADLQKLVKAMQESKEKVIEGEVD